ncbi:MAG: HlyC/CorC family transporter [Oligoflexia bacterium]|nr:HlyC/CorC family transporter [Oligoflexia bacterium]MBF0364743.1 HlyC/CorC family transporter [Oligoflexia bacterium]
MGAEVSLFEFVVLITAFIFSAFYSSSEAVLMSIPVERVRQLIEDGGPMGKSLQFVAKHSNAMLTTILIGNNLVNIIIASMATQIVSRHFDNDALSISVFISTILILFFGEILPKTFARTRAEKLVDVVVKILRVNYYLFYPAVVLSCWLIRKLLRNNSELIGRLVTMDDIEFLVNQAEKDKTIDSKQLDLLSSILEFPTIKVKDIMIPRHRVHTIPESLTFEELIKTIAIYNHSRYPVCEGDLDKTVGFLHVKDLLRLDVEAKKSFEMKKHLKNPFFVYEHMKIQVVFDHMNRKKVHLALVKDENGLVVGIVTLEDIIEEILGEIHDEHDKTGSGDRGTDSSISMEGGVVVDGTTSLRDLYNEYDIKIPLNDNYSTLAGFLLDMLGNNFPKKGMMVFWEGLSFKIEDVLDFEIKQVRIHDVEGEKHLFSHRQGSRSSDNSGGESGYDGE